VRESKDPLFQEASITTTLNKSVILSEARASGSPATGLRRWGKRSEGPAFQQCVCTALGQTPATCHSFRGSRTFPHSYLRGNAWLCTPHGETFRMHLSADMRPHLGANASGEKISIGLLNWPRLSHPVPRLPHPV
jgi:hypothetical protein